MSFVVISSMFLLSRNFKRLSICEVFRVKGFLQKEDRSWIQLNATHNGITMNPIEKGQEVIIVIGEELKEQAIKNYFLKQDNL